jgi:response regulator RpfG family c-di-GMP phosphodiesterase
MNPEAASAGSKQQRPVLLIDSSPYNRKFVSVNLVKRGHTVLEAVTGSEAITLLREHLPSLVILEIEQEDEAAMAVLSCLATERREARIPVVLFTTTPVNLDVVRKVYPHVAAVLTKPVDARSLLAAVSTPA